MAQWRAQVEFGAITDDQADALVDELAAYGGVPADEPEPGRASVIVTVEANTLKQASDEAQRAVADAVRAVGAPYKGLGVEVRDEETAEARSRAPRFPELIGYTEIAAMAGVSRQRARELKDLPGFPPAIPTPPSAGPLFVKHLVEQWFGGWERKPGRPATDPSKTETMVEFLHLAGRPASQAEVREWALVNDISVPSRGRLPAALIDQFQVETGVKVEQ